MASIHSDVHTSCNDAIVDHQRAAVLSLNADDVARNNHLTPTVYLA
jgi:hypothetical protein